MSTIIRLVSTFRLPLQTPCSKVQNHQNSSADWTSAGEITAPKSNQQSFQPPTITFK